MTLCLNFHWTNRLETFQKLNWSDILIFQSNMAKIVCMKSWGMNADRTLTAKAEQNINKDFEVIYQQLFVTNSYFIT